MELTSNGDAEGAADIKVKTEMVQYVVKEENSDGLKRKAEALEEVHTNNDNEQPTDQQTVPAKRGRGRPSRGRGSSKVVGAAGDAAPLDKTARIVLENIDGTGQGDSVAKAKSPRGRGRGRGKPRGGRGGARGTPKAQPTRTSSGRQRKPTAKVKEEVEDEDEDDEVENEEEEVSSEDDFDDDDDDDDIEEFVPKTKKQKGKPKGSTPPQSGRGRGRGRVSTPKQSQASKEREEEGEEEEDESTEAQDEVNADPDAIKTGQYLIDKRDIRYQENFPIWRMEGPNMLRKFEMIVQLGRIRHKSLYAYSSWAQSMKDLYEKIQVTQISSIDGDSIVEIQDKCFPTPPDLARLEEKHGSNDFLPVFQSLLSALFQQASNPNFLATAIENNDVSVLESIRQVDLVVQDRMLRIEAAVNIKEDFKTRVRDCPNMKSIRRSNWSQTDQSTNDRSMEKGVRSVLLFGFGYDANTLVEDKSRGAEVAQEVVVGPTMDKYLVPYHGLYHLKYNLLRRCTNKAKLVKDLQNAEPTLEKLLEDRAWILQAFEDFLNLSTLENVESGVNLA